MASGKGSGMNVNHAARFLFNNVHLHVLHVVEDLSVDEPIKNEMSIKPHSPIRSLNKSPSRRFR